MGTSTSHLIFLALNELLQSALERFLTKCDTIAFWFAVSGNLNVSSWDRLGRDLNFATEQGMLRKGVMFMWFELPRPPEFAVECEQLQLQDQGAPSGSRQRALRVCDACRPRNLPQGPTRQER